MIQGYIDFSQLDRQSPANLNALLQSGEISTPGLALRVAQSSIARVFVQSQQMLIVTGTPEIRDARLLQMIKNEGWQATVPWFFADPKGMLAKLGGRFSLLWLNVQTGVLGFASDRFNTYGFCYAQEGQRLSFADQADQVPAKNRTLDPQALFNYLYFHVIPAPNTIFAGVKRLAPGAWVAVSEKGVYEKPWWEPVFEEPKTGNFEQLAESFRTLVQEAVAREVRNHDGQTGAFLSGGTDSSTVVGMLSKTLKEPVKAYSIGFEAEGYDEMDFARIAAKRFGADHRSYYVTPSDLVEGIPIVAAHYDQPFGNSSSLPAFYCAKKAHDEGVTKLLAGDGGDEFFGGNTRYAKQRIFGYYNNVPHFLKRGLLEPVLSQGWAGRTPIIKKAASYIEQAKQPLPDRLEQYNLLLRLGLDNLFDSRFMKQIDVHAPMVLQQQVWQAVNGNALINKMLGFDWRFTLADNDLPKVIGTTGLANVAVAFPFLDDDLVDFSTTLPPAFKLRGLKLRWFFKEALKDFLPSEILTKKKHGFGLPFGHWAIKDAALNKLAKDSLNSLAGRGVLREDFLRDLFDKHLPAFPGYYGEMVWISMMLEQWLQTKAPSFQVGSR